MLNNILDTLLEFQQQNPHIYIGGSVSLMLQEAIPLRIPKDIDIISTQRTHIHDIFGITESKKHKLQRRHKHNGFIFELFYNPKAQYVPYIYKGKIIKLSPIDEINAWTSQDINSAKPKHANDLKHYYNKNANLLNEVNIEPAVNKSELLGKIAQYSVYLLSALTYSNSNVDEFLDNYGYNDLEEFEQEEDAEATALVKSYLRYIKPGEIRRVVNQSEPVAGYKMVRSWSFEDDEMNDLLILTKF